jgi:hypothetical protein
MLSRASILLDALHLQGGGKVTLICLQGTQTDRQIVQGIRWASWFRCHSREHELSLQTNAPIDSLQIYQSAST